MHFNHQRRNLLNDALKCNIRSISRTINIKLGYINLNSESYARHSIYRIKSDVFPITSRDRARRYYQKPISQMKYYHIYVTVKYWSKSSYFLSMFSFQGKIHWYRKTLYFCYRNPFIGKKWKLFGKEIVFSYFILRYFKNYFLQNKQ